jgi:dipeptidyl aminopeptidase/acylaminoacyl peptidase
VRVLESSRFDLSPSFSPDGKKIVFGSDRAGDVSDLWTADADGGNPVRLTNFTDGFSGSPRWSPDGEWIAFDRTTDAQTDIYVVRAAGGAPRRLTTNPTNDYAPAWSRDGRWIYFGSHREGKNQIWKMPVTGGKATQITKSGGGRAFESADGQSLYYWNGHAHSIWRVPVSGGQEELVLDGPSGDYEGYWALVDDGIYYLDTRNTARQTVEFFSFATRTVKQILDLPEPACPHCWPGFAVSPDQRTLLAVFLAQTESDIMLVDNFRLSMVAGGTPR